MVVNLLSHVRNLTLLTKTFSHGSQFSSSVNLLNSLNYIYKGNINKWQNTCSSYSTLFCKSLFKEFDEKSSKFNLQMQQLRYVSVYNVHSPRPETTTKNLRFKVHYPEDGKYTTKKLRMTKLGGRDPDTGRLIFGKIGGGHKRKYRWVLFDRVPAGSVDPLVERVLRIQYDPNRTAKIALVGHGDKMRYLLATANMKEGDLITSTRELPRIAVRPKDGDAHPVGALPNGTMICCVELVPHGYCIKLVAGSHATVNRRHEGKIIIQVNTYQEFGLDPNCLATVGQISNPDHNKKIIGSAQRARWLGIRPSSGLWQRKSGRHGFKRKYKQPVKMTGDPKAPGRMIDLTCIGEGPSTPIIPSTIRVT